MPPSNANNSIDRISTFQKDEAEEDDRADLTPERFRERTKVFESLMGFINPGEKEPDKDLIDILAGSENGEPMLL